MLARSHSLTPAAGPFLALVGLGFLSSLCPLPSSHVCEADEPSRRPLRELIAAVRPSVATLQMTGRDGDAIGIGAGFVIDPQGLIVTNFHVIGEGRSFTVEMPNGRTLPVKAVEASDRSRDLAIVRVDVGENPLPSLKLADEDEATQGLRVLAFGNPLGLRDSVVEGIVSAVREVEGRQLLQLAMPIEPGNSGGPLVDFDGRVHGIINMKSAIDQNLGFAIPVAQLNPLRDRPNPVAIEHWVKLGRISPDQWQPLFGGGWEQHGGTISAEGVGDSFGGRALLLATAPTPPRPYDLSVSVRLDDESGAAGIAFCSDGNNRHYGFYPSGGRIRFTCFRGPSVFDWQVLHEADSEHYLPGQWNHLRARVENDRIVFFVNGEQVHESTDRQLRSGKVGLVKFRDTLPDFRRFRIGPPVDPESLTDEAAKLLTELEALPRRIQSIDGDSMAAIAQSPEIASRRLLKQAARLENQAEQFRRIASDVRLVPILNELRSLFAHRSASDNDIPTSEATGRLLRAVLLIAALDDADVDVDAYIQRVDEMAAQINAKLDDDSDEQQKLAALDQFLFRENGFHGGRAEYYHPANSHMNRVIDDREGLPITLSILYIELGRRLGLNIDGIGLPGHFVVQHRRDDSPAEYIDVFEGGPRLTEAEAEAIVVAHTGRHPTKDEMAPQTDQQILTRVLKNLMGIAGSRRDGESLRRYAEALVAIDPTSIEFRSMRAQLRGMTDRKRAAIEDFDWLLKHDPSERGRAAARQLRDALRGED